MLQRLALRWMFAAVNRCPHALLRSKAPLAWIAWCASPNLRRRCHANAQGLLGTQATPRQRSAYGRGVLREFLRFVADVAIAQRLSKQAILAKVSTIEGQAHFEQAQHAGRGLIIATCHCGSFEVGAAAVADRIDEVLVLFQGDAHHGFEAMRHRLHQRLGLTEVRVERGLDAWIDMRDALARGAAVLIQADRCMPGQRGAPTPFLHGQVALPDGPAKLARLSGAPVLPIASVVEPDGRTRLRIAPAIDPNHAEPRDFDDRVRHELAGFFAAVIRENPTQWHTLHVAFVPSLDDATA
ncbi:MAG: lysophospholipid acyltransferase family protein [Planctomycetota bacterium]